ncbi:Tol-Pal system beta propeller repeat protein TolB [Spiribacter sp. 218]|uniref:Tol-Pal system beta propeller repeat protein TolB n=1 Tax=Spiribacter pallidus TaxID=1987936 RepID=UPI00349F457E
MSSIHTLRDLLRRPATRQRRPLAGLLLLGLLLAAPIVSHAQVRIEITGGAEAALPIAVVPFATDGARVNVDVDQIIRDNLYRSGLFDPLDPANFISTPSQFDDVRFRNWRALGADTLVVGRIRPGTNGNFQVRYELLDVYAGERLAGQRFNVTPAGLRNLAHTISDQIFEALIGRPGGFNSRIAYVEERGPVDDRQYHLVVAEADGHRPQRILQSAEPLMSPDWSPDGERLAYVSFESGRSSQIFVQEVATSERQIVASFAGINGAPAWSPDGEQLAITLSRGGNPDIYLLDLAGGEPRQLTRHFGIDTEPTWSPDGQTIYFTSNRGGSPQIYSVDVASGDVERVTFQGNYNASPSISGDGRFLAFAHEVDGGFRIAVQDLEEEFMRVLTEGPLDESPSFSASGSMIAYTRSANGTTELATVSVFGRVQGELTEFNHTVREPDWGPL